MKILAVLYHTPSDLHMQSLVHSIAALPSMGHAVTCLLPADRDYPQVLRDAFAFVPVRIRFGLALISVMVFNIVAVLKTWALWPELDIIVFQEGTVFYLAPLFVLARLRGRPKLMFYADSVPVDVKGLRGAKTVVLHYLSLAAAKTRAGCMAAISPMAREEFARRHRIPKEKIGVWTVTVDRKAFDKKKHLAARNPIRKELGVGHDDFLFIYVGSISRSRGLQETLLAFQKASAVYQNVRLLILGGGVFAEDIKALIGEMGLSDRVIFRPPVPFEEVPRYLAAADGGISPLPDNFYWRYQPPIKVLEYISMGKPVVVSKIPAHRWVLGDNPFAFYYRADDPESMAEAMGRLLSWNRKRHDTSELDNILIRFSPEENSRRLDSFMLDVLRQRRVPNMEERT